MIEFSGSAADLNTSGGGITAQVPESVKNKFNWGAFLLTWVWGLCTNNCKTLWILIPFSLSLFFPFIGGISGGLAIWYGVEGNKWAWQNSKYNSIEEFQVKQKKFTLIGILITVVLPIVLGCILAFILVFSSKQLSQYADIEPSYAVRGSVAKLIQAANLSDALEKKLTDKSSEGLASYFYSNLMTKLNPTTLKLGSSIYKFSGDGSCLNNSCKVFVDTNGTLGPNRMYKGTIQGDQFFVYINVSKAGKALVVVPDEFKKLLQQN